MADDSIKIDINVDKIAKELNTVADAILPAVQQAVENLSAATHAHIVATVNEKFSDDNFKRQWYLGQGEYAKTNQSSDQHPLVLRDSKHLRWNKIGNNLWVIELDPAAEWLEKGRGRVSMATAEWLLKPDKSKKAADGSTYRSIPMPAGKSSSSHNRNAQGDQFLKSALKESISKAGINMKEIERDNAGNPKFGVIQKLDVSDAEFEGLIVPGAFSKPRSAADAAATGLKEHQGNFMLGGAAIIQTPANNKAGAKKEAVVFRTVSSKSQAEDRWMYPAVEGINAFDEAERWAKDQWDMILKQLEEDLTKRLNGE